MYEGAGDCFILVFGAGFGGALFADKPTDLTGEPSMTLGEREGMTTAIPPTDGLIACPRPLGPAGVVLMRGRSCSELLGVRTGAACVSIGITISSSAEGS